jgi:hypothetical protein
LDCSIL